MPHGYFYPRNMACYRCLFTYFLGYAFGSTRDPCPDLDALTLRLYLQGLSLPVQYFNGELQVSFTRPVARAQKRASPIEPAYLVDWHFWRKSLEP
jgi:hypothetical protein